MPRPRPTTDQRQHIIRCDDALWKKIAKAAKAEGATINVYLNRLLTAAMGAIAAPKVANTRSQTDTALVPHSALDRQATPPTSSGAAKPLDVSGHTGIAPTRRPLASPAPRPFTGPFTKEMQAGRKPPAAKATKR